MLNAGTPLWSKPAAAGSTYRTDTLPVLPAASTSEHTLFRGVTVRHNEDETGQVAVQQSGRPFARVTGPVAVGEVLVQSAGHDWLVGQDSAADAPPSGFKADEAVAAGALALIPMRAAGSGGGGSDTLVWL